jgi:hypothetical protein
MNDMNNCLENSDGMKKLFGIEKHNMQEEFKIFTNNKEIKYYPTKIHVTLPLNFPDIKKLILISHSLF